jgi:hypothetical protein
MSKQHLHNPKIGPVVQQMGRKGMAKGMRRQRLLYSRPLCVAFYKIPEGLTRHPFTPPRDKKIIGLPSPEERSPRRLTVSGQPVFRHFA